MSRPPRRRVLVTDGDTRPALAATRSLGRAGHEVLVCAPRPRSLASVSRHARAGIACPDPAREPDRFVETVVRTAAACAIEVVLPMTEVATQLLALHRDALPAACRLALPEAASLARANDKSAVLALARDLGVPVPATTVCGTADEARALAARLAWPVVVKPARSRVAGDGGFRSTRVRYARDPAELESILAGTESAAWPLLLQERVDGAGVGIFACYDRGRGVAFFAHRRLREKPPSGGVSVLCESVDPDPAALDYARRMLEALEWHGVAMVEFKRDVRDGQPRLMEINGRFWGSLQLAIDAGVDFPALAVALACGDALPPVPDYRRGVQSRWFLGDLDALARVLFRPRATLDLPPGHPTRLGLLRAFLASDGDRRRGEVLRRDDIRPGLLELRRWLAGR